MAADELTYGSLEAAERYLLLAERGTASVPDARRGQAQLLLGIVRLLVVRQRGDLPAVVEEVRRLEAAAEAHDSAQPGLSQDLRALALIDLGATEYWTVKFAEAMQHLDQDRALAHRIARSYLEFTGLAYQASNEFFRSFERAAEQSRQAIELAERHGWTDEPAVGLAYVMLGAMLAWQMRTWPRRRSPANCPSPATLSRPTCAACTPSSAPTAAPRPSPAPAPWACFRPPHTTAERVLPRRRPFAAGRVLSRTLCRRSLRRWCR